MTHPIANAFREAAELVRIDPRRRGNRLEFEADDEIIYSGDIHGHRQNLARILAYADLPAHPSRRVVLQEIIHGGPPDSEGGDRSVEVLLRAVRLKISRPEQVFFLLANHDLAQVTGNEITKDGAGVCKAFDAGLEHAFGPSAGEVRSAVNEFLSALPLVATCPNGMLMTHSLPSPTRMPLIDWTIFDRPYRQEDFRRGGTAYEWTWGRDHTPQQLEELSQRLGASQFLLGHHPVPTGFEIRLERMVILASDLPQGAIMHFNAGEPTADEELAKLARPIALL